MKLHDFSQKIVNDIFALYKEGGRVVPDKLKGTTIIHIYPGKDTAEEDGTLNGYYQNHFFRIIVFENVLSSYRKMYKPERSYDAIFTNECSITSLSVFKDGAFCIRIDGDVEFLDGQACTFIGKK
jgi:hypothetical protein